METPETPSGLNLSLLRPYVAQRKGLIAFAALLVIVAVGLELWVPILLAEFIDDAIALVPTAELVRLATIFLLAGLGAQGLNIASNYLATSVGWSVANDLRIEASRHVASLDLDYHTDISAGTLIERVDGDVDAVAKIFSKFAIQLLSAVLLLGGIFVLTFRENTIAGWTVVSFTAVVAVTLYLLRTVAVSASVLERGSSAQLYGFIEERLTAIEDIRANGAGEFVMRRFQSVMRRFYHRSVKAWIRRATIWTASIGMFSAGVLIGLGVGAWLALRGDITPGIAFLLISYMSKLEGPIEEVTEEMQELQKAAAGLGRLQQLFAITPSLDRSGTESLPDEALQVAFDDVTFSYGDETVLHNISFSLEPGRHLGLLGRTGSGKSTITKLIARFYDATSGSVSLSGTGIQGVADASLRQRVAVITQDVQLFEGTVKDNVTMFVPGYDDDHVETALRDIGLDTWLDTLPDGIHTHLDTGGGSMSSGEAQLVALARAYLLDPGVVILDEPSSRVDPATEAILTAALDRLLDGRTAVIVAHRLDTVGKVDEIMVLDDGIIAEHGARTELASQPESRFAQLLETAQDGLLREAYDE